MVAGSDNCRFLVNADELDTDGDGLGDACHSLPKRRFVTRQVVVPRSERVAFRECHSETKTSSVNTKSA
jgi:hypothetical protein